MSGYWGARNSLGGLYLAELATALSCGGGALLFWTVISCAATLAQGQSPMPPVRPRLTSPEAQSGGGATPAPSISTAAPSNPQPADASACLAQLKASHVDAMTVPAPPAPLGDCGVAAPVRLNSVGLANGMTLELPDRPIVECAFAVTFAEFVRDLMAPVGAATLGSSVVAVGTGPGYECRGRNGVLGAKTSAHGKGLAVDLAEITFADRRRVAVGQQTTPAEVLFVKTIRRAACGWFTTVLGPGSDAEHAEHLHLDVARHGASDNYRICE